MPNATQSILRFPIIIVVASTIVIVDGCISGSTTNK
jgi:hypothetical protein